MSGFGKLFPSKTKLPPPATNPIKATQAPVVDETPWLTWLRANIGEAEVTGQPMTDFDKMVFGHTNCPTPGNVELPACAATLCAALELSGYKSTHSAAAVSYRDYGLQSQLKRGAIVVFRWADGSNHVSVVDQDFPYGQMIVCTGGNQGHKVCSAGLPQSNIIATRWPVK